MKRRSILIGAAGTAALTILPAQEALAAQPVQVLFVAAHPDDETLAMSMSIAKAVRWGAQVNVLILTQGEASSVRNQLNGTGVNSWWGRAHSPTAEGYTPLSVAGFGFARRNEAAHAVQQLASPGAVMLHFADLPDGGVTKDAAKAEIMAVLNGLAYPNTQIKGHSYLPAVEPHPDHLAVGQALQEISAADPVRFGDRRHYVLPHSWGYSGYLPDKTWELPWDADMTMAVLRAKSCYEAWSPPYTLAIGMHSTPSYFNALAADPKCLIHT